MSFTGREIGLTIGPVGVGTDREEPLHMHPPWLNGQGSYRVQLQGFFFAPTPTVLRTIVSLDSEGAEEKG